MPQPTRRQEIILGLIVREYVDQPTPVSSKALVENYDLNVSSATVRNDMAALEEAGLIASPHTSAGRVPTEEGYRYFVQRLLSDNELSQHERQTIRHQFHQSPPDVRKWMRLSASVLAQTVRSAALVTSPQTQGAHFKHLQLISTQGRMVLMIMVIEGGDFRQQMLHLAEPVSQERLSRVSDLINTLCAGLDAAQIRALIPSQPTLEAEVMEMAADVLERFGGRYRIIYTDGLINVLDPGNETLPEADTEGARQTLRLLEEPSTLESILADVLYPELEGVLVIVSGDNRHEELNHTSMILGR
ncbi:MAG: heat-inducible transcription repressor HrcA, partial [Chloroflexi bacterium]|nr:heat-inducible transcription repressor HrcA [Chloroflexota bacterium]